MATQILPKEAENYIHNSTLFTMFGIVNLKVVRTVSKTNLDDKTLKRLINKRFAKEFTTTKIEYLGLTKK